MRPTRIPRTPTAPTRRTSTSRTPDTPRSRATTALAAGALALALAACGQEAAAPAGSAADGPLPTTASEVEAEHTEADVTFAQGMIPHHRQAVVMSEMALERAEDPEVRALAEEIAAAQEPEIATMTAMLEAWDAEVPPDVDGMGGMGDMAGMDHDSMAGMMSPEQMDDLGGMQGVDFDEMFLTMMVEHHEGAIDMARTELDEGRNPQALALAETVVEVQQAEITRMQELLG